MRTTRDAMKEDWLRCPDATELLDHSSVLRDAQALFELGPALFQRLQAISIEATGGIPSTKGSLT